MIVLETTTASSSDDPAPQQPLRRAPLTRFLNRARTAAGLRGEVTVLLSNDQRLKELNRDFRGKNKPTDVLSFPAFENPEGISGDLAISLDTAARQAAQFGHTLEDELRILILHGLLHLAGYDHETDNGEMAAKELALREKLGLTHSLIQRATTTTRKPAPTVKSAAKTRKPTPAKKKVRA